MNEGGYIVTKEENDEIIKKLHDPNYWINKLINAIGEALTGHDRHGKPLKEKDDSNI